jgi:3-phosphoglycerate kinase
MRTDGRGRFSNFAGGSLALLDAAVEAQKNGSTVIVGGGDTGESGQSFL